MINDNENFTKKTQNPFIIRPIGSDKYAKQLYFNSR